MKKTVWRSGPPPSLGWWPASVRHSASIYRWWDGECWSMPATSGMDSETAALMAKEPATSAHPIKWTDRPASWPERSKT